MSTQRLYMNVYRAGFYHRQGKPGHCNIHAGDFFPSEELAKAYAATKAGYLGTVSFDMPVPDGTVVLANPEGSIPTPLSETRGNPLALMPWHTAPKVFPMILSAGQESCPWVALGAQQAASLEPVDDPLGMTYAEWRAERERTGFAPPAAPERPRQVAALLSAPPDHELQPAYRPA